MTKKYYSNTFLRKQDFIHVECVLKLSRSYCFNLPFVGLKFVKLKSGEFTKSWPNHWHTLQSTVLMTDPDTRTTDTICPDICLAAFRVADILLVLLNCFTDPSYVIEILPKW